MSRIGKQIIAIPSGVEVSVKEGKVFVKGPKGQLERELHKLVTVNITDNKVTVDVVNKESKLERSLWGTFAAHIKNMVLGVTKGFKKQLEINGVGYKAAMQGKDLKLDVGYSNPVIYKIPEKVTASVEKNMISLESADKELLGKVASEIRVIRKPEPYKGKGIKYVEETIRRKAGKSAAKAAA
ncbi:MAG: 50S ribosomal protein L6 [Candidatus Magasanikbacteria bacterium RIFOXYC2_FULL_40_16]|uniref:Large ribosomal subunit protein uL6 n=3 Tax=Candidatus Magasanikiibacteriota TaxID=1752731 RepID=A0A1F6NH80_9BACT|nr:MAG: 50S ribosomal protein L6 [Candidatus Magasanikbacteria bacterium RIFOXYA2_FULL_40_20]OGH83229.1 MAG: 50S ribosomal protein L6 [Candidatus Magasanikbacteria bacterium RIFOXYB1_FULL_40_15]OGH85161.1 MAG: 50S ribosomal protein L6 [Candidatus Magasanikbacteria bacterium RIFOXYB2_FULL_40_13]OGH87073.1 MAG: 50S ribosomal protein L6 [Candidatus Magasanikbacteria bacterium RIFOXYA1_FULL_40_8]OGH89512.1 MAG: 50S ribosomal protein L6 [Candidatus Magasanikbacteria bacterium RIFOXYC2_FULL_40_16]